MIWLHSFHLQKVQNKGDRHHTFLMGLYPCRDTYCLAVFECLLIKASYMNLPAHLPFFFYFLSTGHAQVSSYRFKVYNNDQPSAVPPPSGIFWEGTEKHIRTQTFGTKKHTPCNVGLCRFKASMLFISVHNLSAGSSLLPNCYSTVS